MKKTMVASLYRKADSWAEDGYSFSIMNGQTDMEKHGYLLLDTKEVTFNMPDVGDMTNREIAALRKEQSSIRAEAEEKATRLEERIQSLLCIESK